MKTYAKTHSDLVEWLTSCQCFDIQPANITIAGQVYVAARYKQTFNAPEGARNPGPYTREMFYCIGNLPKAYLQGPKLALVLPDEQHEWYIAGYFPEIKKKKQAAVEPNEYHPFGPMFLLGKWDTPDGQAIDHYEPGQYRRIKVEIELV